MTGWVTNPFRDCGTDELLAELECRRWDLADVAAHPAGWQFAEESRAFLAWTVEQIRAELLRRWKLRARPQAPAWPPERDRKGELEEIKRRITVIDLVQFAVGRDVYDRRGPHDVWCRCPLPGHEEETPSFHIDTARQVWHCFGCGRGGSVFELARHLWDEPMFARVVERLRTLAGLEPPVPVGEARRGPAPMRRARRR